MALGYDVAKDYKCDKLDGRPKIIPLMAEQIYLKIRNCSIQSQK